MVTDRLALGMARCDRYLAWTTAENDVSLITAEAAKPGTKASNV